MYKRLIDHVNDKGLQGKNHQLKCLKIYTAKIFNGSSTSFSNCNLIAKDVIYLTFFKKGK